MAATEADEIDDNEFLLRLIHPQYYSPEKTPLRISCSAFRPNKSDDDGLSFYRELFVSAESLAQSKNSLARIKNVAEINYYVCRFLVKDLRAIQEIGLSIKPDPDPEPERPRGHCIIPELRFSAFNDNKGLHNDVHSFLAKLGLKELSSLAIEKEPN